jgi:hypothetical protein
VLPAAGLAHVLGARLVELEAPVQRVVRGLRSYASRARAFIGEKPRAILRFCRSTFNESIPETVVQTGRLIA